MTGVVHDAVGAKIAAAYAAHNVGSTSGDGAGARLLLRTVIDGLARDASCAFAGVVHRPHSPAGRARRYMSTDRTRRPVNLRDKAEALFKPAAPKLPVVEKRPRLPGAREMVSLRIDRAVLEHFQSGGPGWQDRVNDALRQTAGISGDGSLAPGELNSSNDG